MPTTRPRRASRQLPCLALVVAVAVTAGCQGATGGTGGASPDAPAPSTSLPGSTRSATALPSYDPLTTVADYAEEFPVDLLAAPEGADVLASSATPGDHDLVRVSLNLSTGLSPQEIVDAYAGRLDDAGFDESDSVEASGLDLRTAFTRTRGKKNPRIETVQIGVLDDGDRRLVSLSGTVQGDEA